MRREVYRYTFRPSVSMEYVESALLLAILGTEALYGESQARLDAAHALDRDKRACVVAADTGAGRTLSRLFCCYLRREYGEDAFRVQRLDRSAEPQVEERTACA